MWPHFVNLLCRSWNALLNSLGTTTLSVVVFSVLVPLITNVVFATVHLFRQRKRSVGVSLGMQVKRALQENWLPTAISAGLLVAVWVILFSARVVSTTYDDHQSLVKGIGDLQGYARDKQKFDSELRQAHSDAEVWHNAYSGLLHGDIHPDRVLNSENSSKLFEALKLVSKNPKNKEFVTVEMGGVQDREAISLRNQFWKIFNEARWIVKPRPKLGKEFEACPTFTLGVTIWSENPQRGMYLVLLLKDAGVESNVNPCPMPQGVKGTIVWVGYKQWP
ncbi:MAG TPA: hypothetical protein VGR03_12835 [Candidatus Acidoferrum sp.]|nr:hypothetical protein [Candidatus Acidoferrum sp.]